MNELTNYLLSRTGSRLPTSLSLNLNIRIYLFVPIHIVSQIMRIQVTIAASSGALEVEDEPGFPSAIFRKLTDLIKICC